MTNLLLLIPVILLFCYFLYRKFYSYRASDKRVIVTSEADQKLYNASKHKDEEKSLTWEEKLELSWAFFAKIAQLVKSKFSKQEQELLDELGNKLVSNGMQYQHDVEAETKKIASSPNLSQNKKKDISI